MKSNNEMAQDILFKVSNIKRERELKRNRLCRVSVIALALVLLTALSFSFSLNSPKTQTHTDISSSTGSEQNKNSFLVVANATHQTETVIKKGNNLSVPFGGMLIVKRTPNQTVEEMDAVMLELASKLTELYGKDNGCQIFGNQGKTTVYFGTADYLKLKTENPSSIEKITLSCSENGRLSISAKDALGSLGEFTKSIRRGEEITLTGKEYKEIYSKDGAMLIDWFLSESLLNSLQEEPDTPLSSISDEIKINISYIDGSEESFCVLLEFDDNGTLKATYKN